MSDDGLRIEYGSEVRELDPGETLTFGRSADLVIDDNARLHRVLGRFQHREGGWWLRNEGTSLSLVLVDTDNRSDSTVAPGAEIVLPERSAVIRFRAGRNDYEIATSSLAPANPLRVAADLSIAWLEGLADRPVTRPVDLEALRTSLGADLPDEGQDPVSVLRELSAVIEPGLVASAGPRYFGFVTGGALPAAVAADWLVGAWDQNTAYAVMSPAAGAVEEIVIDWLARLLGLPAGVSGAIVTGGQMANTTCLAAARNHVLAQQGWDVERRGLAGAPPIRILVGGERHVSVDASLRLLGLGGDTATAIETDGQGRMVAAALADTLRAADCPTIICAQAGNVNSGAFDPLAEICEHAAAAGAWVHVDGAFGLWAAASPSTVGSTAGVARADSWATDGHKWLNVPYDCGFAFTAHPDAHRRALSITASYLVPGDRDGADWSPEASRRARSFVVYAALRSLGRAGVADLVDRCCRLARRFAEKLDVLDGTTVLNDVVLNQVLVRFGDSDDATDEVISRVQASGECWMGATTWHGQRAMRISVSNWSTTEADVDRSVAAITDALRQTSVG